MDLQLCDFDVQERTKHGAHNTLRIRPPEPSTLNHVNGLYRHIQRLCRDASCRHVLGAAYLDALELAQLRRQRHEPRIRQKPTPPHANMDAHFGEVRTR